MKEYEVLKTDVLGVGPWYVSPKGDCDVLGTFRYEDDAKIFAEAKAKASQQSDPSDRKGGG